VSSWEFNDRAGALKSRPQMETRERGNAGGVEKERSERMTDESLLQQRLSASTRVASQRVPEMGRGGGGRVGNGCLQAEAGCGRLDGKALGR
jgi:hypothetical protein